MNVLPDAPTMENSQKDDKPVFDQCRMCRIKGEVGSFHSIYDDGMNAFYFLLTGIEVKVEDPAPKIICIFCKKQLKYFYELRTDCIDSYYYYQEKLQEMLQDDKESLFGDYVTSEHGDNFVEDSLVEDSMGNLVKPKSITAQRDQPLLELDLDKIVCNECNKEFQRKRFLWHWRNVHWVDEHPSTCTYCGKVVPSIFKLEIHHRIVHGLLKCLKCDKRPPVYSGDQKIVRNFLKHFKQCGKDPEEDPFECSLCQLRYTTYERLTVHEANCTGRAIMCHICSLNVPKESFRDHMEKHPRGHFPCTKCGKIFTTKKKRYNHMVKTCTTEKVICDFCNKTCRNKTLLYAHIRQCHLGYGKKYEQKAKKVCTFCGKLVACMEVHLLTHDEGTRKYTCDFVDCDKKFRLKQQLKKHLYSHSNSRPYNCNLCETGYYHTDYLRGHYKRDHGIVYEKGEKIPYTKKPSFV